MLLLNAMVMLFLWAYSLTLPLGTNMIHLFLVASVVLSAIHVFNVRRSAVHSAFGCEQAA